jgi:hypothetical protein
MIAPLMLALAVPIACGPAGPKRYEMPVDTDSYSIRVSWTPTHAYAREVTMYRFVIRDKKTKEPIENGEGQVFATNRDGINTYDSFTPAPESGTYTARLKFITSGDWALALRFRRDSSSRLERNDWRQSVLAER